MSINQERLFLAKSVYDSKVKVSCSQPVGSFAQCAFIRSRRMQSISSNLRLASRVRSLTLPGPLPVQAPRFAINAASLATSLPTAGLTLPAPSRRELEKEVAEMHIVLGCPSLPFACRQAQGRSSGRRAKESKGRFSSSSSSNRQCSLSGIHGKVQ